MSYYLINVTPEQLQLARNILKLTQQDVCKEIKISIPSYRAIEAGQSDPKLSNFKKIVTFYTERNIQFNIDGINVTKQ